MELNLFKHAIFLPRLSSDSFVTITNRLSDPSPPTRIATRHHRHLASINPRWLVLSPKMAPATSPILLPLSLILLLLALCSPSPPFLTSLSSRGGSSGGSSAVDTPKSDPSAPSKTTVLETTINRSYDEVVEACLGESVGSFA